MREFRGWAKSTSLNWRKEDYKCERVGLQCSINQSITIDLHLGQSPRWQIPYQLFP